MVMVRKQSYGENSKRVPGLTGGGHGAPRGYKGVKGDLLTAARRRWPVKGAFLENVANMAINQNPKNVSRRSGDGQEALRGVQWNQR
jgi:hypothetical protein